MPAVARAQAAHSRSQEPSSEMLARLVFALLVVACFLAFFLTQRLKHTPTAVQRFELTPRFSPGSPISANRQERISFKVATAGEVTVEIIDSRGDTVATLVRDHPLPRYKQFSLRWSGRQGTAHRFGHVVSPSGHEALVPVIHGRLAPAGEYRVRVILAGRGREVLSPRSFALGGP